MKWTRIVFLVFCLVSLSYRGVKLGTALTIM